MSELPDLPVNVEAELDDLLMRYRRLKKEEGEISARLSVLRASIMNVFVREGLEARLREGQTLSTGDRVRVVAPKTTRVDPKALVKKGYITTGQLAEVTTVSDGQPYLRVTLEGTSEDV